MAGLVARKLQLGETAGSMSLIALSPDGGYGAATTENVFPFVIGTENGPQLMACLPAGGSKMHIAPATAAQLDGEP